MSLEENSIPQGIIQKIEIPKGHNNLVKQDVTQNILVYVLSAPAFPDTASINTFIQTGSDIGKNNRVSRNIDQSMGDIPLFGNNFAEVNRDDIDENNLVLDYNQFVNNDDILDAVQFINQQSIVKGSNNHLVNYSQQIIYDLSWYNEFEFNQDNKNNDFDDGHTFDDFLEDLAGDYILDSVQFVVQDINVFGNKNSITQELEQTIATFVILDDNFIKELQEDSSNLSPVQLVIQDNFIDKKNNRIEQNVTQNIKFDFSFSNDYNQNVSNTRGKELRTEELSFNIDDFILPVIDNISQDTGVFANQENRQVSDIFGDANTDIKRNGQILVLSETDKIVFPSFEDDIFKAGSTNNFDGLENLIFAGAGNDTVSTGGLIKGSKGDDLIVGSKGDDLIVGGKGDDLILGDQGNDLIKGGKGDDLIVGGKDNNLIIGVDNNILTGGAGKDQFVLSMGSGNVITDFASDYDRILIQGTGDVIYDKVSGNLSFNGTQIAQLGAGTELDINKDIKRI